MYLSQVIYCGGYSGEDPPLPIPNREVKLTSADGTAPPGGRVGSCRFSECPTDECQPGILRFGCAETRKAAAGGPSAVSGTIFRPPGAKTAQNAVGGTNIRPLTARNDAVFDLMVEVQKEWFANAEFGGK